MADNKDPLGLGSFLFGNVDESGQLDNDAFDADLVSALRAAPLSQLGIGGLPVDMNSASSTADDSGVIRPAADAIDYSDMQVDDDVIESVGESADTLINISAPISTAIPPPTLPAQKKRKVTEEDIKRVFPHFSRDKILKFSQLFNTASHRSRFRGMTRPSARLYRDYTGFLMRYGLMAADERALFESDERVLGAISDLPSFQQFMAVQDAITSISNRKEQQAKIVEIGEAEPDLDTKFHPIHIQDWESNILWGDSDQDSEPHQIQRMEVEDDASLIPTNRFPIANYDLETGEWEDMIVWDESEADKLRNAMVEINLNDPNLSVEVVQQQKPPSTYIPYMQLQQRRRKGRPNAAALKKAGQADNFIPNLRNNQTALDRFNMSNDRYYESLKKGGRVRQQFGKIFIQHSLPALKLQIPLYKRDMSKSDMRAFHRPPLRITPGDSLQFIRMKNMKKKIRWKGRDIVDVLSSTRDLTLRDNTDFVLFEYSEEYPPLLSNGGMGSFIMNYYRKKDEKDQHIPRMYDGAPGILENVDASPFFGFGDVPPGQTMQAIKNNLYVAPIFKQELNHEDFLLIRVTYQGQTRCYVRTIPRCYTVGQTFPLTEVHPPQSRKAKAYVRDRLKTAAFRRIRKRGRSTKYAVTKMVNNFQRYHEQSLRKHLRDTFNIKRSKKSNSLLLILKPKVNVPSEQECQRMVVPEMACVFESMRVGQQRLADCGYGTGEFGGADADDFQNTTGTGSGEQDPQNLLDDEIQMAPWNVTRNFLLAAQQKGMVHVFGPGDPTGRGEGFSFFWFSMKEMFLWAGASQADYEAYYASQVRTGHRFSLQDQQRYYKGEIDKVWQRQLKALSSTEDIVGGADGVGGANGADEGESEAEMEYQEMAKMIMQTQKQAEQQKQLEQQAQMSQTGAAGGPASVIGGASEVGIEGFDHQSIASSKNMLASKCLLIRRKVKDELGNDTWQEEVVVDVRVINAYFKQRKIGLSADDDDEARKRKIQQEIRALKKQYGLTNTAITKGPVTGIEKDGTRRLGASARSCRSCGQIGHIMTNRICPDFEKNFPDKVKKKQRPDGPVKAKGTKLMIKQSALKEVEMKQKKERTLKLPTQIVMDVAGANGESSSQGQGKQEGDEKSLSSSQQGPSEQPHHPSQPQQ